METIFCSQKFGIKATLPIEKGGLSQDNLIGMYTPVEIENIPWRNSTIHKEKIMSIEFNGKTIETDEEGFLLNESDWSEELAVFMAQQDKFELTPEHWELINFIREYYAEYQISPAIRVFTKAVGKRLGKDKGNNKYLYDLFPYGPSKEAARYGGLPKATGDI